MGSSIFEGVTFAPALEEEPAVKYAIFGAVVTRYYAGRRDGLSTGSPYWRPLEEAVLFKSMSAALDFVRTYRGGPIEIHRITEVTTPATREVVKLEGMVDHAGLKYALTIPLSGRITYLDDAFEPTNSLMDARLHDSVMAAVAWARKNAAWVCVNIVGIRETPGSTVRKAEVLK